MGAKWIMIGAALGALSVIAGAFGAHGLKQHLTPADMAIYQTAVTYQMYHALALVLYGLYLRSAGGPAWPAVALLAGIVVFSGSLYLLVFTGVRMWGAVTPIGGVAFIVGWLGFAWSAWRSLPHSGG